MGGDFAPKEIVAGAVEAARSLKGISKLFLVGDEAAIRRELSSLGEIPGIIEIRHASEVVAMDESPATAIRSDAPVSPWPLPGPGVSGRVEASRALVLAVASDFAF